MDELDDLIAKAEALERQEKRSKKQMPKDFPYDVESQADVSFKKEKSWGKTGRPVIDTHENPVPEFVKTRREIKVTYRPRPARGFAFKKPAIYY